MTSSSDDADRLLSLQDAAHLLSTSTHTLRAWIAAGDVRGYRVGGRIKLRRSDVLALARPIPAAAER